MTHPKGRIVDSEHGLFIFTPDGVYRYNHAANCFREVKFEDASGTVIQSIGTSDGDPDVD